MFRFSSRIGLVATRKTPKSEGIRGMATLKAISIRLKSVKNIQKITQSMKMVSAAKYSRAERELKQIKPLGDGAKVFYQNMTGDTEEAKVETEAQKKTLYIAMTSDRGLCGAVHTSVAKVIRNALPDVTDDAKIICVGDKARSLLQRIYGPSIVLVCQEVGRLPATFLDASRLANEVFQTEFEYEMGKIVFNRFRSVVSYITEELNFFKADAILQAEKLSTYEDEEAADDCEEDILSFIEFSVASLIFYAMKEAACSEQSSRMTAMDNASKNASEMIQKLTLTFNRTRQAVITRELIEIISGASAL